mmetsp:Transcript_4215/g.18793  ORF Transcript_4215/g.18793 Transcript_4215/m.18793 type:complete len:238 (+) Transcript_4215:715-1428(+)
MSMYAGRCTSPRIHRDRGWITVRGGIPPPGRTTNSSSRSSVFPFPSPSAVEIAFFIPATDLSPPSRSFPMQHGATTNAARLACACSSTASVPLPHTCSARARSQGPSYSSMRPTLAATFARPASLALADSRSIDRGLRSNPTKSASGCCAARGSSKLPVPHPKSTIVGLRFDPPGSSPSVVAAARTTARKDSTWSLFRLPLAAPPRLFDAAGSAAGGHFAQSTNPRPVASSLLAHTL